MTDIDITPSDFRDLLLEGRPLIDTRAPCEFAKGSPPSAINLPLMDDSERAAVGLCYKQEGPDAAIALGHRLVSGERRAARIDAWKAFAEKHPNGALFCFRGGMRSQIVQQWMAEAGVDYPRIEGGYKALRRWSIEQIERIAASADILLIAGRTGSGKTEFINHAFKGEPIPGSVDLEGLAHHRGSAFGKLPGGQPAQITFELAVAIALVGAEHHRPIILEDESRLIGRCALPPVLQEAMARAPVMVLDSSLEARIEHSYHNYIVDNLAAFEQLSGDPVQAWTAFSTQLIDAIKAIRKRLGGVQYDRLSQMIQNALDHHQRGDPTHHRLWIGELLTHYYDPMYNYQLEKKGGRVIFTGDYNALAARLC
ncbi:tRNA 2-selenouridine synthase [Luminiphilus syltensis NOR5-1B]|uniref:tRNA 2-selenouridine synthase n=1 Tax=Luminiphilus syltensis NOR5-1B TaxID=565045 RepID=B8KYB3_9GAMM|nr:tRNA 2-selenouridine(34) synthase MnmH [Luminiphilus syltensis]EED35773.1 tRNA 2-selenouridine synthase [Luminiphilus syltensis NOR5-1B]